jgi:hypothetical protein
MEIYWSLSRVPELAGLSKPERTARWRRAYAQSLRDWRQWLAILATFLFILIGNALSSEADFGIVGVVLVAALGGFGYGQIAIALVRPYLRAD